MIYNNYILTVVNGHWCAYLRGELVAEGSKEYVFSVLDECFT